MADKDNSKESRLREWLRKPDVRFTALGSIVTIAVIALYVYVFNGVLPGSGRTLEYYEGLDESYGKYYEMQELLEEQALFSYSYEGVDDQELADEILGGLEDDDYAEYYPPEKYDEFRKKYFSFVGVGISATEENGKYVIVRVISDSSAGEAGVCEGDIIVSVDGKISSKFKNLNEMFTGKEGDKFKLVVDRDGEELEYELELRKITDETVTYGEYDRDNSIGYIRIRSFSTGTSKEFEAAIKYLEEKGIDKVIIDLRNNLGGSEKAGLDVADQLLPECTIITEKRRDKEETVRKSDDDCIPMEYVLLVNEFSASSSEIVTSAVKANKGGKIIGTTTYGKGLIQVMHSFNDGSAVKFTIGEYYAADGSKIQGKGVKPDIECKDLEEILRIAVKTLMDK